MFPESPVPAPEFSDCKRILEPDNAPGIESMREAWNYLLFWPVLMLLAIGNGYLREATLLLGWVTCLPYIAYKIHDPSN